MHRGHCPTKLLLWKRTDSRKGAILKAEAEIVHVIDMSESDDGPTLAIVLGLPLAQAMVKAMWPTAAIEVGG